MSAYTSLLKFRRAGTAPGGTLSPDDLQAWAASDPGVQQIIRDTRAGKYGPWLDATRVIADYQRKQGKLATGYHIDPRTGAVAKDESAWDALPVVAGGLIGLGAASGIAAGAGGGAGVSGAADLTAQAGGEAGTITTGAFTPGAAAGASAPAAAAATPPAVTAAAKAPAWQTALKYGLPALGGALDSATAEHNAEVAAEERRYETNQSTALDESKLDPYRGVMHQTSDIARLERGLEGPATYAPAAGSPYARAVAPPTRPALSPTYLMSLQNAQQGIASNDPAARVPTMTDPANWGNPGTMDLTGQPTGPSANDLAKKRRRPRPLTDPSDPNAWLTALSL